MKLFNFTVHVYLMRTKICCFFQYQNSVHKIKIVLNIDLKIHMVIIIAYCQDENRKQNILPRLKTKQLTELLPRPSGGWSSCHTEMFSVWQEEQIGVYRSFIVHACLISVTLNYVWPKVVYVLFELDIIKNIHAFCKSKTSLQYLL